MVWYVGSERTVFFMGGLLQELGFGCTLRRYIGISHCRWHVVRYHYVIPGAVIWFGTLCFPRFLCTFEVGSWHVRAMQYVSCGIIFVSTNITGECPPNLCTSTDGSTRGLHGSEHPAVCGLPPYSTTWYGIVWHVGMVRWSMVWYSLLLA